MNIFIQKERHSDNESVDKLVIPEVVADFFSAVFVIPAGIFILFVPDPLIAFLFQGLDQFFSFRKGIPLPGHFTAPPTAPGPSRGV